MKIAICDDDIEFLERFKKRVCALLSDFSNDFLVTEYNSGKKCISEIAEYDVVFLDIDMPEITGLEIADYINKNASALIIFVSEYDGLVYSSIKFQPFRFLRKTYLNEELPEAIQALVQKKKERKMTFKTKLGETVIEIDKLIYIDIYIHRLMFYTVNNEPLEAYGSLTSLEKMLSPMDFIRVHNSYLVNCKYIYSIETNKIVLDNRVEIPLSKHRAKKVNEKFADYLRRCL